MVFDVPLSHVSGIYCAIHKSTGLCYVGSSINVLKRLREHFYKSRRGSMNRFHIALREFGVGSFDFTVVEECAESMLLAREKFYIAFFNAASFDGLNTRENPCATYDYVASPATRARISASKKGRKPTAQQIANQIAGQIGLKRSVESRKRMSDAAIGKVFSSQHRAKLSAARKGTRQSAETIEKKRAAMLGKACSAESVAKQMETKRVNSLALAELSIPYEDRRKSVVVLNSGGEFAAWYPSVLDAEKEHSCPRYYLGTEHPNRSGLRFYYATAIYHPMPRGQS